MANAYTDDGSRQYTCGTMPIQASANGNATFEKS